MFLRNYDNIVVLFHFNEYNNLNHDFDSSLYIGSSSVFGDGNINVRKTTGDVTGFIHNRLGNGGYDDIQFITPLHTNAICIGTGDTDVTYDDYTLSGDILDNTKLVFVSSNVEYDATDRKVIKTATFTYTNETENDITISEWGLFHTNYVYGMSVISFSASTDKTLLFREVLETPIVIEAGTTATLKFKVDVPISNHP